MAEWGLEGKAPLWMKGLKKCWGLSDSGWSQGQGLGILCLDLKGKLR